MGAWVGPQRWLCRLDLVMVGNPGAGAGVRCDLDPVGVWGGAGRWAPAFSGPVGLIPEA